MPFALRATRLISSHLSARIWTTYPRTPFGPYIREPSI